MKVLLNVIWVLLAGIWVALGYGVAAIVMALFIITIPFAVQAVKLAAFSLWPFGQALAKRPGAGAGSLIGNVLWVLLIGWWLAVLHVLAGVLLALTIIGIPLALASFKLAAAAIWPFGREIVSSEAAEPRAIAVPERPIGRPPPKRPA